MPVSAVLFGCMCVYLPIFLLTIKVIGYSFPRAFILIRYHLALLPFPPLFIEYIDLVLSASVSFLFSICRIRVLFLSHAIHSALDFLFALPAIFFHFYASFGLHSARNDRFVKKAEVLPSAKSLVKDCQR